jgi:hypothetical protein
MAFGNVALTLRHIRCSSHHEHQWQKSATHYTSQSTRQTRMRKESQVPQSLSRSKKALQPLCSSLNGWDNWPRSQDSLEAIVVSPTLPLADKWSKPYSTVCGYVNEQMSIAILHEPLTSASPRLLSYPSKPNQQQTSLLGGCCRSRPLQSLLRRSPHKNNHNDCSLLSSVRIDPKRNLD